MTFSSGKVFTLLNKMLFRTLYSKNPEKNECIKDSTKILSNTNTDYNKEIFLSTIPTYENFWRIMLHHFFP